MEGPFYRHSNPVPSSLSWDTMGPQSSQQGSSARRAWDIEGGGQEGTCRMTCCGATESARGFIRGGPDVCTLCDLASGLLV